MKVTLAGCGNISKCHFSALERIPGIEIAAVADIVPERAEEKAKKYGCRAYTDYDTMLNEVKPGCVHICTPHYLHGEMAQKALSRGINVLCEKPLGISRNDIALIKTALSKTDAQFGVCFQNRYNPSVLLAEDILKSGKYGRILSVRGSVHWNREKAYYCDDWHGKKDKEGGGVLINQSIHTLDLLLKLTGKEVKAVSGELFSQKFYGITETEDSAFLRMVFDDDTVGIFTATVSAGCDFPVCIELVCEKASLRLEGDNVYEISEGKITRLCPELPGEAPGKPCWGRGHEALIRDFYDCIKTGRKFPVDVNEGEKALSLILSVYSK